MDESSAIVVESRLEQGAYRRMLLILSLQRLRFLLPILVFFAFAALASRSFEQAFFLFAAFLGTLIIVWLWVTWQAYSPSNAVVRQPVRYSFAAERIDFRGADQAGIIEWGAIKRWRYVSGHYLLHHSSASFLAIPEGCVRTDDRDQLEALFRERIAKGPRGALR